MGPGLTPAAQRRIRLQLALIPAYVWLVDGWRDLLIHMPFGPQPNLVRDFVVIYMQALIGRQGNPALLYDADYGRTIVARLLPGLPHVRYPLFYPPQVAVLFTPLAHLSYETAMAVWLLISIAAYFACGYAVWRTCPRLHDRGATVCLLLAGAPALYFLVSFGQMSAIALACVTSAYVALKARRDYVAGVCVGLLAYKPTLGLAAAFVFVAGREWRVVLGAIGSVAAQVVVASVYWGPGILAGYVRAQLLNVPDMQDQYALYHLHSWRAFLEILGLPPAIVAVTYAVAAACVLVAAVSCWRSGGPLAVRFAVLLIATVLVNPHVYAYDCVILIPALLLLWDWSESFGDRTVGDVLPLTPFAWLRRSAFSVLLAWLLYFCYLSPRFALFALLTHVQISVPALTLLGFVASVTLSGRRRRQPAAA